MFRITVNTEDLQRFEQSPVVFDRQVKQGAWRFVGRAASRLRETAPNTTSHLANSIRPDTGAEPAVLVAANYAGWVHEGRAAGRVDVNAIYDWAKAKRIPQGGWYAIARSIARKGTKAQPWIRDFLDTQAPAMLDQEMRRALG